MPVAQQSFFGKFQGLLIFSFSGGQAGKPVKTCTLCLSAPCGFVEGIECLLLLPVSFQGQPQIKITFPGIGVRIFPGLFFHGGLKVADAVFYMPSSKKQEAVSIVQADIRGVPSEAFQIIGSRIIGGMTVLFQVGSRQVKLFRGSHILGSFHRTGGFRDGFQLFFINRIFNQDSAAVGYRHLTVRHMDGCRE